MKGKLTIITETDDYIVINKPAGLLSVPDRFDLTLPNIKHLVQRTYADAAPVHRLDKDTSGILLMAKHPDCHTILQQLFETRKVQKEYVAIVSGHVKNNTGLIQQPLVSHPSIRGKMHISNNGKPSETFYEVIESYPYHSFLRLRPKTGRTHQLRVHLAHVGHPIICDPVYGNGKPFYLSSVKKDYKRNKRSVERPLISRTALHACALTFSYGGKTITIDCEMPKDMRATSNQLRKLVSGS